MVDLLHNCNQIVLNQRNQRVKLFVFLYHVEVNCEAGVKVCNDPQRSQSFPRG